MFREGRAGGGGQGGWPGFDFLGRKWYLAFVLGMQVGKPVVKSLSVPVTVAGRGTLC